MTELDHTADLGIDVRAPSLEALFHRAGRGMMALLREGSAGREAAEGSTEERTIRGEAGRVDELLVRWLRELLHVHETESLDYLSATFARLEDEGLEARVRFVPSAPAVREIKGVTYHDLSVRRVDAGWTARVIFDV
ncbi:MAG: archease [Gemmatimonadota bacterium]|nr:archease [Gemmatimonadota bacterium]